MSNSKNRNILIIAVAVALCFLMAAGVYFALQKAAPKNDQSDQQPSANNDAEAANRKRLAERADSIFHAGEDALKTRKPEEAAAKFKEAKKLYEQAGETMKAEQLADQIILAEHEAKVDEGYEAPKAPEDPAPQEDPNAREFNKTSKEQ